MAAILHRLLLKDLQAILGYYRDEAGPQLAERLYAEFEGLVGEIEREPKRFHLVSPTVRRANFRKFPYHLLYRESATEVRILTLRHHRRSPSFGIDRQ